MAKAKAEAQPGATAPGFIVTSPLLRNGESFAVGAVIDLSEEDAAPLLYTGTVKAANQDSAGVEA